MGLGRTIHELGKTFRNGERSSLDLGKARSLEGYGISGQPSLLWIPRIFIP
jgi:hypothetical protein